MQIQVNTDHNIKATADFDAEVEATIEAALGRFTQLTTVLVHLSDDNGAKSHGDDKRCLLEARPAGMQPVVVTHVAGTVTDAVDGAADKMTRLLTHTFGKLHDPKGNMPLGEVAAELEE